MLTCEKTRKKIQNFFEDPTGVPHRKKPDTAGILIEHSSYTNPTQKNGIFWKNLRREQGGPKNRKKIGRF